MAKALNCNEFRVAYESGNVSLYQLMDQHVQECIPCQHWMQGRPWPDSAEKAQAYGQRTIEDIMSEEGM